jgi:hypothetical protein
MAKVPVVVNWVRVKPMLKCQMDSVYLAFFHNTL